MCIIKLVVLRFVAPDLAPKTPNKTYFSSVLGMAMGYRLWSILTNVKLYTKIL